MLKMRAAPVRILTLKGAAAAAARVLTFFISGFCGIDKTARSPLL
jgi:hypothetical protein